MGVTSSRVSTGTGWRNVLMPGQPSNARRSISLSLSAGASLATLMLIVTFRKADEGRIRDHVAAHVELGARDRLEAVVGHSELGRVEGEHRGIAADHAGEQKLERGGRTILPAHVHGLADDELVAALPALDELVELADGGDLDLDEALRPFRRRLVRMRAVAALARVGDVFQLGKAIADLGHQALLSVAP